MQAPSRSYIVRTNPLWYSWTVFGLRVEAWVLGTCFGLGYEGTQKVLALLQ